MSYTIKILDSSYNQQLLALSQTRTTGSDAFTTDRSPDYFALPDELGSSSCFGILKNDQLIGSMGVARQTRMVNGHPARVLYLFDLKVHPDYSGKPTYYRLVQHVMVHLREAENATWAFSTILDTNGHVSSLTKGAKLFPGGRLIGQNYHVGFPLFVPMPGSSKSVNVEQISAETAWQFYLTQVEAKGFAPADKAIFCKANGFFLGCFRQGNLVAVGKVIEQSHARKICLTQPQPFAYRLLNLLCRYYKCPLLPGQNEIFRHGYLGFYAAAGSTDYRKHFLRYIRKNYPGQFSYVFSGLTAEEAATYRGAFLLKFTSSNYGYGELPENLALDAVELTLI